MIKIKLTSQYTDDRSVPLSQYNEGSARNFVLLSLKGRLKLEILGMKVSKGKTAYSQVKTIFGFKGNRSKVYDLLCQYIEQLKGSGL
jgi:hypothetical protein